MADERLPLIHGRVIATDRYQAVQGGGDAKDVRRPSDAKAHAQLLARQLDELVEAVRKRPPDQRDEGAHREIVAIQPRPGEQLELPPLGDKRAGVRVVGEDPHTHTVILDAPDADLRHLRRKVDEYADNTRAKITEHEGAHVEVRKNEKAIAPIESVGVAVESDLLGRRLREQPPDPGTRT
jgi:hypothetical protein